MKNFIIVILSFVVSGCGPYFYKYELPKIKDNLIPVNVIFYGNIRPQAAYFLNGSNCSNLRDLEFSQQRYSRQVFVPKNEPASFHVLGMVSVAHSQNALTLTTCGNQILTFLPEDAEKYDLIYQAYDTGCTINLIKTIGGVGEDESFKIKRRIMNFTGTSTPSSSFCTDEWQ